MEASDQPAAVNHELEIESELTALLRAEPVADTAAPSQVRSQVEALRRAEVGVAEENDADVVAGDFDTSTCRECGKAKMSSIEEAWEKTLLGSGS